MSEEVQVLSRWVDPTIKQLQQENKQLKERIDKAIEYIEEYGWEEDIIGNTCSGVPMIDKYMRLDWDNCNELLEILKGENNE